MRLPEYRARTLKTLEFLARKVDENLVPTYKPKIYSLDNTGAGGTPDEHPNSDIDLKLNMDRKTLNKYETEIGRYCANLQLEAQGMLGRDVTIWLQPIEDFKNTNDFRLYACNAVLSYGTNEQRETVSPSDLPSPITNKILLAQWAAKEKKYPDVTCLSRDKKRSKNVLADVRKDPTLHESVRWEGYEMAMRGGHDLVTGVSNLDTIKVSKAVHRFAHALHISLGRRVLTDYEEVVDACHGMLADDEDYENLVINAGKKRDAFKEGRMTNYDFNDEKFIKTLLDFARLAISETKEVARREGYFAMPERMACMDYYLKNSIRSVAHSLADDKSIFSDVPEFSELFAEEVADLLLRYKRMTGDSRISGLSGRTHTAAPEEWVERLNRIGIYPMLSDDDRENLKGMLEDITTEKALLEGKLLLVSGDNARAARKLDDAIESAVSGEMEKRFFSYTMPNENLMAELYLCRGDASDGEEAAEFYENSLKENVFNPYCWYMLGNIRRLPNYRHKIAVAVGESMQSKEPWSAYLKLHLNPQILGEKGNEIWEEANKKRLERFEKHVRRLEEVAEKMKSKSPDSFDSKYFEVPGKAAREYRNALLKKRAEIGRKIKNFLGENSPVFGILLDRFVAHDIQSRKYVERAEMMRRSVLREERATKRKIIRQAASGRPEDLRKAMRMAEEQDFEELAKTYKRRLREV